jgi:hypothetical protein
VSCISFGAAFGRLHRGARANRLVTSPLSKTPAISQFSGRARSRCYVSREKTGIRLVEAGWDDASCQVYDGAISSSCLAAARQRHGRSYLGTAAASAWVPWTAAFVQRLQELGWTDGRTIAIQYRWADGRAERWAEFAAELARLKVDVIVTGGNAAVAAKQASSVIPIVFAMVDDPVAMGLVASFARLL